jgi:hypothetical protein
MIWFRKNISGTLLSFILALVAAWLGNKYCIIGGMENWISVSIMLCYLRYLSPLFPPMALEDY